MNKVSVITILPISQWKETDWLVSDIRKALGLPTRKVPTINPQFLYGGEELQHDRKSQDKERIVSTILWVATAVVWVIVLVYVLFIGVLA